MIDIQKLLDDMGIKVQHKDPFMEASETPIEAMMTDMQERGLLTDELIDFMTPYLELERMHISLAFDEGTAAAAMVEDQLPPSDGIDYFGQVYT